MRMVDIIAKKRDGKELSTEEIQFLVDGYTNGSIPDYQMSAWAMAVLFRGMTPRETGDLTMAMARSGEQLDLTSIPGVKVDKHSTGGVGDKTTLVVAPLVAAAGIPVAKMSGRGLGHSGGTIDKLESFAGFQVERTREQFFQQVRDIGVAVIGQSGNLTPADKKLYALRDVTATVEAVPLIASSIMSKKIAAGADAILLDVKVGKGAFMKTLEEAETLARAMVDIGSQVGRKTVAVISDMNQPLGFAVGNALEVKEAIATLAGNGPKDLTELALAIGARMLVLGGLASSVDEGRGRLEEIIASGKAVDKLAQMVEAQGGNKRDVYEPDRLPQAGLTAQVTAQQDGYLAGIDAETVGHASVVLGAGRLTKEMPIDLAVGIVLHKKRGDRVRAGEPLATLHANDERLLQDALKDVAEAFAYSSEQPPEQPLIYKIVE
ncbi:MULTISPECIES: pyrimidine-nucleoside phosphorylase [Bacillales]|jgi:pyrimidine-nucleoside phosphorylase|uniref:Pyrimidine-nucleoside phosphorylase n=1 Tax=Brevibacillus aydinogluensis TaxID=927786 RepID=A0AA48MAZ4_9BACL|nr:MULTISPECIES: pyrimidine-nucleoside phosphorylase [Bacillales]REK62305.1 MAG: pyrimidine-nucleoside phosphorylase [Brevibacillus sp.]MDT3415292.1 pyrimidine-nucleoside phosphorylase [Brevibacillus aydinogluensis]NNV02694.1 pyrimidine-nucleoside phosphorylase [Brevibacillus sp. MCWH]UFJ60383.1 pyrimidine-nucleoside phosphorylase [Anoxybacillus sediminis]CAJ1002929.1 pyrimidine-nucleoside phosphorylase [Brevibacillus aydinogluensis]